MKPTLLSRLHRHGPAALTLGAALLASAWQPACAQQKLDAARSEMAFTSKQMGVPVDGKFRKFDAQVNFDPKKPEAAKISLSIDTASITLGSAETDAEVLKPLWFNAKQFPQASFTATSVKALGGGKFNITGPLVIKGQSREVLVPVSLTQSGGITTAAGSFTIKRGDFKLGEGEWADTSMVAADVQVRFKLLLSGVAAL